MKEPFPPDDCMFPSNKPPIGRWDERNVIVWLCLAAAVAALVLAWAVSRG